MSTWASRIVETDAKGRLALISHLAAHCEGSWYWADLSLGQPIWMEFGFRAVAQARWMDDAQEKGITHRSFVQAEPMMLDDRLFPANQRPSVWAGLLASTSVRAAHILRTVGTVDSMDALAAELTLIYTAMAPREMRADALAWHLGWLTGSPKPAAQLDISTEKRCRPDADSQSYLAPELGRELQDWSTQLPPTATAAGPRPAWLPVVARLAHVHAVRLTLDPDAVLESAALQAMVSA